MVEQKGVSLDTQDNVSGNYLGAIKASHENLVQHRLGYHNMRNKNKTKQKLNKLALITF